MIHGLLGKKLGMTGVFLSDGTYVPVTIVEAGPCIITQIKTKNADGYDALQVGFGEKPGARVNKPLKGHMKKSGDINSAFLREFQAENIGEFNLGQKITVDIFQVGSKVDVSGISKGRGFAGVIKRHGFNGGRKTHGSHSQRIPGSIGCSAWPSKVIKGKKLPGHYGVERNTLKNLEIIDIRPDENLLFIKGALPGTVSSLLEIKRPKAASAKKE